MKFAPIRKFGKHYYIIKEIHNYSDVYSAIDSSSNIYIIKSYPKESSRSKLLKEIKINQKLNIPENNEFFVKYISSSIDESFDLEKYIVFEQCEKGPLSEYVLRHIHFEETFLKIFIYIILDAVFHMHRLKIVHMDINLEHIFIDKFYNFKIGGFSHSLFVENNKNCYFRKDLLDLGFLFMQILSGKTLKNNRNYLELIQIGNIYNFWKAIEIQGDLNWNFSDDLKDLINKMFFTKGTKTNHIEDLLSHDWFNTIKKLNKKEMKENIKNEFKKIEGSEFSA